MHFAFHFFPGHASLRRTDARAFEGSVLQDAKRRGDQGDTGQPSSNDRGCLVGNTGTSFPYSRREAG